MKYRTIILFLFLCVLLPVAGKVNGPTASFQVKWHVENHESNYCELTILDFTTGGSELTEGTTIDLAYINEWQGLFLLEYRTNMINQNHTLILTFTPLAANGQTSLGFSVDYMICEIGYLWYNSTTRSWDHDQNVNVYSGSFNVSYNVISASSGQIPFLAQHPIDTGQPIVTKWIPIRLKLNDMNAVEGSTYLSDITITVEAP